MSQTEQEPRAGEPDEAQERAVLQPGSLELLELRLERFGPHKSRIVRFAPGLNLLYGPNASGKSTVVAGLYLALAGHALQPSARPADYAQDGAVSGLLSLTFRAAPTAEAARPGPAAGRAGTQLSLYLGSSGAVTYELVRSTGGDVELALREGAGRTALASTPQTSRLAVQRMLGIEAHRLGLAHFLREDEVGHFLSQTAGERKDLLRAALALDQWERALKIFREARRLARLRHKEVAGALKQLSEPLGGPEARIAELRRQVELAEESHHALLDSEGGERLAELGRAKTRARGLEQELEAVLFPLPSSAHLVLEMSKLEEDLERLSTAETDLAFARQRMGELLGLQQSVTSDLGRLRSLLDAGEHHCPTCEQPLDLGLIQSLIDQKQRTLDGLHVEATASRARLEEIEGVERDREEARRRYADLRVKREKVRTLTAELEGVLTWVETARSQLSGEAASKLVELEESIASGRAEIERLLFEQGAAAERREQYQALRERGASAQRLKLRLEAAVEALEAALAEIAEGWFNPLERRLQTLLQSVGLLGGVGIDVHSNPMRPRIVDAGGQRDFVALSGSERALLYLCFKAALAETVGIVPFLVLDEPTVHLDPERKRRLVRLLRQFAGTRKQVVVASNDPWLHENLPEAHVINLAPQ
jgi:DNA repair exonuclease SbcCD ATPase subunit